VKQRCAVEEPALAAVSPKHLLAGHYPMDPEWQTKEQSFYLYLTPVLN
jgi:hypothetical protein